MIRCLRGVPTLQRRFLYVAIAFGLLFMVYILVTNNEAQRKKKGRSSILEALKDGLSQAKAPTGTAGGAGRGPEPGQVIDDIDKDSQGKEPPHNNGQEGSKEKLDINVQVKIKKGAADLYTGPENSKQEEIRNAFLHAWNAYKRYAWGHDELRPISHSYQEWFGGIGLTLVDSLDTMYIMGLKDEFQAARDWVASELHFNKNTDAQLFEIVIRALGGLLSAYHLSGDKVFVEKAEELGTKLMPCFKNPTTLHVPCNRINLERGAPQFVDTSTAEAGTIQLEMRDLSRVTGDKKYEEAAAAVSDHLHGLSKLDGLVATFLSPVTGAFRTSSTVSAGASADSYYEYLLKQWLQTGKTTDWYKDDFAESWNGMKKHLLKYSHPNKMAFVGALTAMHSTAAFRTDMEHLACFLPGAVALGVHLGVIQQEDLSIAENLTNTCYQMYRQTATGLGPEVAFMNIYPSKNQDILPNPPENQ